MGLLHLQNTMGLNSALSITNSNSVAKKNHVYWMQLSFYDLVISPDALKDGKLREDFVRFWRQLFALYSQFGQRAKSEHHQLMRR